MSDIGDLVPLRKTFRVENELVDPVTVTFQIRVGTTLLTYIYGTHPQLVRESLGVYLVEYTPTASGTYYYRWSCTGIGQDAEEGFFRVPQSNVIDDSLPPSNSGIVYEAILPYQGGHAGHGLFTDGVGAFWAPPSGGGGDTLPPGTDGQFLKLVAGDPDWENIVIADVTGLQAALNSKEEDTGWFNVRSFGATGDGITNDGPAFSAAFAAALLAGGGIVFVPSGSYRITTHVSCTSDGSQHRVIFRGSGGASVIIPQCTDGFPVFQFNYLTPGVDIEDLTFDGITGAISTENIVRFVQCEAKLSNVEFRRLNTPTTSTVANYDGWIALERVRFEETVRTGTSVGMAYVSNLKNIYGWRGFRAQDTYFSDLFGAQALVGNGVYFGDPASHPYSELPQSADFDGVTDMGYVQNAAGGEPTISIRFPQDQLPVVFDRCQFGCSAHAPIKFDPTNTGRYSRVIIRDCNISVYDGVTENIRLKQIDFVDIERVWIGTGGFGTSFPGIWIEDCGPTRISHCYLDGDDLYRPPIQGGTVIVADSDTTSLVVEESTYSTIESDCPTTVIKDGLRATLFTGAEVDTGSVVKVSGGDVVPLGTGDAVGLRVGVAMQGTARASGYVKFVTPADITEGDVWTISDGTTAQFIRLTVSGASYPGAIVVSGTLAFTADQWASAFASAINAAHGPTFKITSTARGDGSGIADVVNDDEGSHGNVITISQSNTEIPTVSIVLGAVLFVGMSGGASYVPVITHGPATGLSDGTTIIAPGDRLEPSTTVAGRVKQGTTNVIAVATTGAAATLDAAVSMVLR